jgi:hypothetical protein
MQLHMEMKDSYFLAVFAGKVSLDESIAAIAKVITACRASGADRILVDVRGIEGATSVTDRYFLGTNFASSGMRSIRTAMVCREDQFMADLPLENTAVNRGAQFKATPSESEALAWLGVSSPA